MVQNLQRTVSLFRDENGNEGTFVFLLIDIPNR